MESPNIGFHLCLFYTQLKCWLLILNHNIEINHLKLCQMHQSYYFSKSVVRQAIRMSGSEEDRREGGNRMPSVESSPNLSDMSPDLHLLTLRELKQMRAERDHLAARLLPLNAPVVITG